jgi:alcohol dehydrogenase class IV
LNNHLLDPRREFRWIDGERTILYGDGALAEWRAGMVEPYTLLCTARSVKAHLGIAARSQRVLMVPDGLVAECAAALRGQVIGPIVVALGGGRVIDTAKAIAAVTPDAVVHAIPTTLSGAEMTSLHRHAAGVPEQTPRVRARTVVYAPWIAASMPAPGVWAGAANALAHAVEAPLTRFANPVTTNAAGASIALIRRGIDGDRRSLALGAMLAGYSIGSASYGVHHVLCQVLAAETRVPHDAANAVMLPRTVRYLQRVAAAMPVVLDSGSSIGLTDLADELLERVGGKRLRDFGVSQEDLVRCADVAARRPQISYIAPTPNAATITALYEEAW